ncbi:zinc ribbon domain-containing protein [Hymenobacter nivis]|uniref:Zinc ribbon domain-containing protein n=1 Tax=Hymenobacter nivis TaxID=1850093 RepID=A0A502HF09_9BACT|nr:zinc ribbon domain-containing protein [Hymenobacter nivis]TPG72016.1 zinc ribbon domain-containing protein [Hymenobacter nivis]
MRATCETCGQLQPPDWQPGDLCGQCGGVVRREKRCHWCVKLTPDGKFCRHCGAGQVPGEQFGAARWLKHLGIDQFALPDRLAAMDPEQAAHFTRLYQQHAMVAERHVQDVAYAEGFARQRGWARACEETLLPLLPLPEADLKALTLPPHRGTTDLELLLEIRQQSPLVVARLLGALARIRLWQAGALSYAALGLGADVELALPHLQDPDPAVRLEVALTLSHWRFGINGAAFGKNAIEVVLREAAAGPLALEAGTNLALLAAAWQGKPQAVRPEALASEDPEIAFAAALAHYAPEPLLGALRVPRRQFAAALVLTRAGVEVGLAALLPAFTDDERDSTLRALANQGRPRPDLRAYFKAALAGPQAVPPHTRDALRGLLALDLQPGDAARLLREHPDRHFGAQLLKNPALTPPDLADLCRAYVELNLFTNNNLPGGLFPALPPGFVAEHWRTAPADSLQGLSGLARQRLETGPPAEVQALHTFLRGVLWDEAAPLAARRQANQLLISWYEGYHQSPTLALGFTEAAAGWYFGSWAAYVAYFVHGAQHLGVLIGLETEDKFLRPLQGAAEAPPAETAAFVQALAALPPPLVAQFRAALVGLARHYTRWGMVNRWAVQVLAQLQAHAPWRAAVRADLASLADAPDDQAAYLASQALAQ